MTSGRSRKPVRREVSDRTDAIDTNLRRGFRGDCRLFESPASDRLNRLGDASVLARSPQSLVGKGGVEPPRPYGHTDLNRARLPFRHLPAATRDPAAAVRKVSTRCPPVSASLTCSVSLTGAAQVRSRERAASHAAARACHENASPDGHVRQQDGGRRNEPGAALRAPPREPRRLGASPACSRARSSRSRSATALQREADRQAQRDGQRRGARARTGTG